MLSCAPHCHLRKRDLRENRRRPLFRRRVAASSSTKSSLRPCDVGNNTMLSPGSDSPPIIPFEVVRDVLMPFLGPEELVSMRMTCREMDKAVTHYIQSHSVPFIVRECRLPSRMSYRPDLFRRNRSKPNVLHVEQTQHFCFLLRTVRLGYVKLDVALTNHVWDEADNVRYPLRKYGATVVSFNIQRTDRRGENDGSRSSILLLTEDIPSGFYVESQLLDESRQALRCVRQCVEICANRLGSLGTIHVPSTEYVLHSLPTSMRVSIPRDLRARATDRIFTDADIDWKYRPAPTLEDWRSIFVHTKYKVHYAFYPPIVLPWYTDEDSRLGPFRNTARRRRHVPPTDEKAIPLFYRALY